MSIEDSLTGTTRYAYDAMGTLTGATYGDGESDLRLPDAVGNLFRSPNLDDRQYAPGGQLRQAAGTRYRYDDEGNLTSKTTAAGQVWRYAWDGAGQLASVALPSGYVVSFGYDVLGRRTSKRYRGRVTHWVWDGDKVLHEWTELEMGPGTGSLDDLTTWLFEENSFAPAAKLTARGSYSVVTDHLGTPLELYDHQGKKTWQAQLDSYGAVRQGLGRAQDCPFRYQGQYEDTETGLYYNRFRYYDPEIGQYISQDPIRLQGGSKLYSYVKNNNFWVDRFGLSCGTGNDPNLDWSIVKQSTGETRFEHVNKHGTNNLQKPDHGVFYGEPVDVVNNAWSNKGNVQPISQGGTDVYHIPYENSGYKGGYSSQGQNLNHVTIVTRQGTNMIVTGFPSYGP